MEDSRNSLWSTKPIVSGRFIEENESSLVMEMICQKKLKQNLYSQRFFQPTK